MACGGKDGFSEIETSGRRVEAKAQAFAEEGKCASGIWGMGWIGWWGGRIRSTVARWRGGRVGSTVARLGRGRLRITSAWGWDVGVRRPAGQLYHEDDRPDEEDRE